MQTSAPSLAQSIKSASTVGVVKLLGRLPLGQARRLGAAFGGLAYRLNTRMVRVTRRNIELCLTHLTAERRELLVRESLRETGRLAPEACVVLRRRKTPVTDMITHIDGEALVRALVAEQKGLIVLAPHLGNWEVLGTWLPQLAPTTSLYQPPRLAGLETLVREGRQQSGSELVPTSPKGVAALIRRLKSGGICGILPDQNPNSDASGEFVPFFGQPAFTMTLVYKLLQKSRCNAVFAFAKRVDTGFELVFRAPPEDIYSEDSLTSLAALNKGVEKLVLEAPEQYQWEYKRFKRTRRESGEDFYRNLV